MDEERKRQLESLIEDGDEYATGDLLLENSTDNERKRDEEHYK